MGDKKHVDEKEAQKLWDFLCDCTDEAEDVLRLQGFDIKKRPRPPMPDVKIRGKNGAG